MAQSGRGFVQEPAHRPGEGLRLVGEEGMARVADARGAQIGHFRFHPFQYLRRDNHSVFAVQQQCGTGYSARGHTQDDLRRTCAGRGGAREGQGDLLPDNERDGARKYYFEGR